MPRKKIVVSILICTLLTLSVIPVYGAVGNGGNASVCAMYYRSANATLIISTDGRATATGSITGLAGTTTKTTVHLYLQQYKSGKWENVDDWLDSGATVNRTLSKTKTVEKGYKYRTKASCYAYSGTKCEHVTKYSKAVSYGI